MSRSLEEQIAALREFSACDVSDALLKIQKTPPGEVPRAGYLADIIPFAPTSPFLNSTVSQPKIIAPASTLKLVDKSSDIKPLAETDPGAIPKGSHWVDLTEPGTVLVIDQPSHHTCAAVGGIMAVRMTYRGVVGCIVSGRVRDLTELQESGLPIWASGRSTVGTGAEARPFARNVPVSVQNVEVKPGDIVFADPVEGIVIIPQELLEDVLSLMPKLVAADDKVKKDVINGGSVAEAFKRHRD